MDFIKDFYRWNGGAIVTDFHTPMQLLWEEGYSPRSRISGVFWAAEKAVVGKSHSVKVMSVYTNPSGPKLLSKFTLADGK